MRVQSGSFARSAAMTAADTHRSDASEHVANVFAVTDQCKESACLSAQARALALGQSAPDAVTFAVGECVLQAIEAHIAVDANAFRGITGTAALRKEQVGIRSATKRARLPVVSDFPHARVPLREDNDVITLVSL